jgi:ankyrin repeat protein
MNQQSNPNLVSPLHILSYYGHRTSLEFLLKYLPNLEVKDISGRTPLDLACSQGELSCVECLMQYGANCESRDAVTERTAIHSAAYNNNEDCLKAISIAYNTMISRSTNRKNSLYEMNSNEGRYNYEDQYRYFNSKLANVRDKHARTPLMLAVEQGHLSAITFLITQMVRYYLVFVFWLRQN